MAGPTEDFFADLSRRGRIPMLARASGTIRFELTGEPGGQRWFVRVDRGQVDVSHDAADADAVVRVDADLFDGIASGRLNALAAMLRGDIALEGDPELLVLFQRLFPAQPVRRPVPVNGRPL
jgi:putative sterol carrier protein